MAQPQLAPLALYLHHVKAQRSTQIALLHRIAQGRAAQSLLSETNIPVSLIATKVGYSNFSYFSQVFKKYTGMSPVEYRAAKRRSKL